MCQSNRKSWTRKGSENIALHREQRVPLERKKLKKAEKRDKKWTGYFKLFLL